MTTDVQHLLSLMRAEVDEMQVTAQDNPAVHRCARAYLVIYANARCNGDSDASAKSRAGQAYRLTMPPLAGNRNVRDFIACATHGMLLGILERDEVTKLLYAAQVAHTVRRPPNKPQKTVQEPVSRANKPFRNRPSET